MKTISSLLEEYRRLAEDASSPGLDELKLGVSGRGGTDRSTLDASAREAQAASTRAFAASANTNVFRGPQQHQAAIQLHQKAAEAHKTAYEMGLGSDDPQKAGTKDPHNKYISGNYHKSQIAKHQSLIAHHQRYLDRLG